jgi:hypothetical protein
MNPDRLAQLFPLLEIAFRTNSAELKELERALAITLHSGQHFSRQHGQPAEWSLAWNPPWVQVDASLRRTSELILQLDDAMAHPAPDRLTRASAIWEAMQSENQRLATSLSQVRTLAARLPGELRPDWNRLAGMLEVDLEAIHNCSQALRIKLELLEHRTEEEVNQFAQSLLALIPSRVPHPTLAPEHFDREYRRAALQLQQDQHRYLGFQDVLKSLLMWVESPEERMRTNRSLHVPTT